ncbi:MAG: ParA family protein [Candidatus Liptonbacteria bacterium]
MARVITVFNAKGGVAKTTSSTNLSAYLATMGRKVLLVDFDPQGNASSALGSHPISLERSIYHGILGTATHDELITPSALFNLHYIPAAPHLAGALVELVNMPEREYCLRKFLNAVRHRYDYIFIDLPPSLSLLTINGLMAGDEVLIPVQAEYYSLEGLGQLLETVALIRSNLKHDIKITGALLTMYDQRERLSREVEKDLRANFPHYVFETVVPRSVALAEAPSFGRPVLLYKPDSSGAKAYKKIAEEIILSEKRGPVPPDGMMSNLFGNFNISLRG